MVYRRVSTTNIGCERGSPSLELSILGHFLREGSIAYIFA